LEASKANFQAADMPKFAKERDGSWMSPMWFAATLLSLEEPFLAENGELVAMAKVDGVCPSKRFVRYGSAFEKRGERKGDGEGFISPSQF
jgi:hypothetical protein